MAWTAPKTFVSGAILTAAELNTHLRDNLNETCPNTAAAAGDLVYADGANSMGSRVSIGNAGALLASTGTAPVWRVPSQDDEITETAGCDLTSFTDLSALTVSGVPSGFTNDVQVTAVTGVQALVLITAKISNDTAGAVTFIGYRVSGATTQTAIEANSLQYESSNANDRARITAHHLTNLTAGTNTFTCQAKVSTGTANISQVRLAVIPF